MWFSLIGKAIPFLLASSTTTKEKWTQQKPSDLTNAFQQLYTELQTPGPHSVQITPTLSFAKVLEKEHEETHSEDKPVAVYLPGLDGLGITAARNQFADMARTFDFWRFNIDLNDRSSFIELVNSIANFLQDVATTKNTTVTLIGESCGGLMASAVAIKLKEKNVLNGLVLVNPATSFDQTAWDSLVPLLTSLKALEPQPHRRSLTPYGITGSLLLSGIIPDRKQLQRIINLIISIPGMQIPLTNTSMLQEVINATLEGFTNMEEQLPPDTLEHRVQEWLMVGSPVVNARLKRLEKLPILVVAGREDGFLPSAAEARRIQEILPHAETLLVPDRGHYVLDDSVNLTEAILFSKIDPLRWNGHARKRYDPIVDWTLPPKEEIDAYIKDSVDSLRSWHSPVFISTDANGKRRFGLSKIPVNDKPILFVGNHQFAALDLRLILSELLEQRGMFPRGLAHPVTFINNQSRVELRGRIPGLLRTDDSIPTNGNFVQFGAVLVNPKNYYRLLQTGQDVLLFPGGSKEALSGRKDYPLFWPEKVDFVRTAARFNATIIPLSAIGMVDSVNVLLEPQEVFDLPFVGEQLRNVSMNLTAARYDEKAEEEVLGFPVGIPTLPARNYFLFGKPISTAGVDPRDKEACRQIYMETQDAVREGLDSLLKAREKDPFRDTPKRILYERVYGKRAPTFPIEQVH